ncbi:M16 family metallopeptidase [Flavobacterium gilvum]|uniref:Peptidase M16 n=1 Tax=Flavobacterium gilvum TaxID=1492737 RepID=A0AAC9I3Y4_9FLAO|nr:pitrilysin family protein [Flavobacterium gilvum]AOW09097.1 peptidase M16 [Flavobacterium gilvum]KFC60654.1 peptidase M16 [Flavobacterium gilvum]
MQATNRTQPKPGKSPIINIKKPKTFVLSNGMKVLVVENHKLPRVSFNLSLDNAPFTEGNKKGVDELTGNLIGNESKKRSKIDFHEEIDFLGAEINFSSHGATANSISKYGYRILELMAEGVLHANFTQEEFEKERAKLIEGMKAEEKSVPAIANRIVDVLAFGKNHPTGEFMTEETLNNITLADVENNYKNYFVPENAYLVIIGDVKYENAKAAIEKLFGSWEKKTTPKTPYENPVNVSNLQINFVDVPNAVQSEITLVNTLNLKMGDPDFFPTVIANQILGGDFNSYLNMNLREEHGWTYGARSNVGVGKYTSKFFAKSAVRNAVTHSAVVEFIKEIKRIRTEKVTDEVLATVKAGYIGRFVMQVEKPQAVARYALNIETEKLPADFYEKYIQTINSVTADDILRVANSYFLIDNIRIVIVGKGSEIIPNLEKLKIPMFYFDRYGNPLEKPILNKEIPKDITAKIVFENYINAIGGEKAIQTAESISMIGSTSIPQAPAPLTYISKTDTNGNSLVEITMGSMSLMKQVISPKRAYSIEQGQRHDFEGEELAEMRASAIPFEEILLVKNPNLKIDRIEAIDGKDAFAIINGKTTYFYDTETGLKLAEFKTIDQDGEPIIASTHFGDYKEVKNIKFPFSIIQNIGIELDIKISEIKINEGVNDTDFQ